MHSANGRDQHEHNDCLHLALVGSWKKCVDVKRCVDVNDMPDRTGKRILKGVFRSGISTGGTTVVAAVDRTSKR